MQNLPVEVYHNIFHRLSRPDIQTCFFVCKRWSSLAIQIYSNQLIIDDYKVLVAKIRLAGDNLKQHFQYGHLVRKLVFISKDRSMETFDRFQKNWMLTKEGTSYRLNQLEFLLFLKQFPNIEEIDLTNSNNFTNYISFLSRADLPRIKKITVIPFGTFFVMRDYLEYLSTCFRFCETLTSLNFYYTEAIHDLNDREKDALITLSRFKSLKELMFDNRCPINLTLFQIQELCPKLTGLIFVNNYLCPEEIIKRALDKRINSVSNLGKDLQHLNINLLSLPPSYVRYLTEYLPNQLHTLNINISDTGLYNWIEDTGMEDALKLMKKVGELKKVEVFFKQRRGDRTTPLTDKLKMTKWYQVVNAFKGSKKVLCIARFRGFEFLIDSFAYDSSEKQLNLMYGLEDVDYYGREENGHTYDLSESISEFALPTTSISCVGPEIIDRLVLDLDERMDNFILKFLRYTLLNCVNLEYFTVLRHLKIQRDPNEKKSHSGGIQKNLKMVHFTDSAPTNNIINVISAYLPNIQVMVLGNRGGNSTLDLTRFKNLEHCYFNIQKTLRYVWEPITIKLQYADGYQQCFYFDGEKSKFLVKGHYDTIINSGQTFTFICNRNINFTVCFGCTKSIADFNINNLQGNCYRFPNYLL